MRHFILSAYLLSVAVTAWAGQKVSNDLGTGTNEQVDVIVQFKKKLNPAALNRLGLKGAIHKQDLDGANAAVFTIPARLAEALAKDDDVNFVTKDRAVQAMDTVVPDYGWMTASGLTTITQTLPYDGTGITIAIIDSGSTTPTT